MIRILTFAKYYSLSESTFKQINYTGYGLVVKEISELLSLDQEVHLLTHRFNNDLSLNNVKFIKKPRFFLKIYLFSKALITSLWTLFKFKFSYLSIKVIYYEFLFLLFKYHFNILKPELIHIHGLSLSSIRIIKWAISHKIKIIVTLHGVSTNNNTKYHHIIKEYEKKFLEEVHNYKHVTVTLVSVGLLNQFKKLYSIKNLSNIFVINNPLVINGQFDSSKIDSDKFIFLTKVKRIVVSIGNISTNKNQFLLLSSINLLSDLTKNNTLFVFIGRDNSFGRFDSLVKSLNLTNVYKTGPLNRNETLYILKNSYCSIMTSISEGFGLPIIESLYFGIPAIFYENFGVAPSLENSYGCFILKDRSEKTLADKIENVLRIDFDKEKIKVFSSVFLPSNVKNEWKKLINLII